MNLPIVFPVCRAVVKPVRLAFLSIHPNPRSFP
jgi:hypothetical protein